MRKAFMVIMEGDSTPQEILTLLAQGGLRVRKISTIYQFDEWVSTLPKEEIEGLAEKVAGWFRNWGDKGGDASTEYNAIEACRSNSPYVLAQELYNAIAGYSKSSFEAAWLIEEAIIQSMQRLGVPLDLPNL